MKYKCTFGAFRQQLLPSDLVDTEEKAEPPFSVNSQNVYLQE